MALLILVSDHEWTQLVQQVSLVKASCARIEVALAKMEIQMSQLDDDFTALEVQATANTNAEQAAAQLLAKLAAMIGNSLSDPTRVQALSAKLKVTADALAAAIVTDTPAEGQTSQPTSPAPPAA